jgi:hypothetical protein
MKRWGVVRRACEYEVTGLTYVKALLDRMERLGKISAFKYLNFILLVLFYVGVPCTRSKKSQKKKDIFCFVFISNYMKRSTDLE